MLHFKIYYPVTKRDWNMKFQTICEATLKVFLTLSLNLFVKELAQFILNPTSVQYVPLLSHGTR